MEQSDWLTILSTAISLIAGAGISWVFFRTQLIADFKSIRERLIEINVPRDVNNIIIPQTTEIRSGIASVSTKLDELRSAKFSSEDISPRKLDEVHADIRNLTKHGKLIGDVHSEIRMFKDKLDIIEKIDNSRDIAAIKSAVDKLDKDLNKAVTEILDNVKQQQMELALRIQTTYKNQASTATESVRNAFRQEINQFVQDGSDRDKLLAKLVDSFMEGMRVMGEYQRQNIEKETSSSIQDIERKITNSIDEVVGEVASLKNQLVVVNK